MAMRAGIAASSFVRQRTTCYWWSNVSSEERSQIAEVLDHGMRRVGMYRSSKLVLKSLPIMKISIVLLYFQLWKSHIRECVLSSSIFELRVSRSSKKSSIFSIASLMSTIGQRFSPSRSVCALFHYPKEAVQKSRLLQSMRFCFSETVPSAKSVAVFQPRGTKT
ncbi:hypothetical protein T12_15920 [Trichinella patagoniensis]|uniref:Uncharacterized protein n=1 Tax=Trichinella patagoniensis TaxID=990121 RepID=A0A0V0Z9L0_9BILA|nr:hypothetical protein T12_15920 [Trichinella patagoniensis]